MNRLTDYVTTAEAQEPGELSTTFQSLRPGTILEENGRTSATETSRQTLLEETGITNKHGPGATRLAHQLHLEHH